MTTYGHFTVKGFEERKGNPYFEQHGQWYRITEVHPIPGWPGDGRVNYQAEECDERDAIRWEVEQAHRDEQALREAEVARAREAELAAKSAEHHRVVDRKPPLYEWAKTQGYGGRGRISNELRRRYAEEFRLQAVPGQAPGKLLLDDDE